MTVSHLSLLLMNLVLCIDARNILVIVDNPSIMDTHSIFLAQLSALGDTHIKLSNSPNIALKKYGEYLYQDLVILAPSAEEFGGDLTAASVIEFIDDGGNVFLAAGPQTGEVSRDIASEVGLDLDEDGTHVMDHLNFDDKDKGYHNLVIADPQNLVKSERIVGKAKSPLLYRGLGMVTDPSNPLVVGILTGDSSSYSYNPEEMVRDYPHAVGKNTVLIAGLQARNNARVVVTGSLEFLSDEFFSSTVEKSGKNLGKSGNQDLAGAIVSWCFQQTGVIQIDSISHKRVGDAGSPGFYTVREECEFSLKVSEYVKGAWVPYKGEDIQMEFVRIDPFIRQRMVNKNGLLTAKFKIPDVYGVFKFKVDYARLGLTHLSASVQVSVHPLRHNQYERFISSAYPYYASAFSMMFGVFVFAFVFLHLKEESKTKSD